MTGVASDSPVGVVGAGTMGAGIAEVAARAGHPVRLLDVVPGAADRGLDGIRSRLARDVEKGRLDQAGADGVARRLEVVDDVAAMAGCAVVVEAVAERLDVKRELFAALEEVLADDALLATNTSSLSVTAIAATLRHPGRVVGMHFFNPAPRMRLVEVVRGDDTDADVVGAATDLARAWGKTPVTCTSTPGFIVNRVARPFYGEAQRMAEEGVADPATIDAILRECGGFPMGPFELTDLVGQDVNLAVSRSVWEQTFGDPRYAPTVFQQRLVDAGRLGRKSGRGVFDYGDGADGARPSPTTEPSRPAPADVRRTPHGWGPMEPFLDRVQASGLEITTVDDHHGDAHHGDAHHLPAGLHLPGEGVLMPTDGRRAASWSAQTAGGVVLLDWMHDASTCTRVALAADPGCTDGVLEAAVGLCQAAGVSVSVVADRAGIVVARTVAMLVNEAVELVTRGEATAGDVDVGMRLGTGYPAGPLEWGDALGPDAVEGVLHELHAANPSGRYRPSPVLADALPGRSLRDL